MSENKTKSNVTSIKKGFRQAKKPTKKQVQAENQALTGRIQATLQFLGQQVVNLAMESRTQKAEANAMANLLRCDKSNKPIEKGDQVMIDYLGRLLNEDGSVGELFDGGYGLGYVVEVGSKSLVPGFEEALLGKTVGSGPHTIDVTFPDNYPEKLKGKKAQFQVKVIGVWKPVDQNREIEVLFKDLKKAELEAKQKEAEVNKTTPTVESGAVMDSEKAESKE